MRNVWLVLRGTLEFLLGAFLVLAELLVEVPRGIHYILQAETVYYGLGTTFGATALLVAGLLLLKDVRRVWVRAKR